MGFSRQEHWSGQPFSSSRDLPHPGIEPESPALAGGFLSTEPAGESPKSMQNRTGIPSFLSLSPDGKRTKLPKREFVERGGGQFTSSLVKWPPFTDSRLDKLLHMVNYYVNWTYLCRRGYTPGRSQSLPNLKRAAIHSEYEGIFFTITGVEGPEYVSYSSTRADARKTLPSSDLSDEYQLFMTVQSGGERAEDETSIAI